MEISVDISLYPFSNKTDKEVNNFISGLERDNSALSVDVNGMSTQIAGPYSEVMDLINNQIKNYFTSNEAAFVLKVTKGDNI